MKYFEIQNYRLKKWLPVLIALLLSSLSLSTKANSTLIYPPSAPAQSTGSHTVNWMQSVDPWWQQSQNAICVLFESLDGTNWEFIENTVTPVYSITLQRPTGIYHYRVTCFSQMTGEMIEGYPTSVTVNASPPPGLAEQIEYSYQVRSGDLNSDGRLDLFIKRTTSGSTPFGIIDEIILTQTDMQGFSSIPNPTSSQLSTANGWSVANGISPLVNDFNVDGYIDVYLKGVSSVATNADDLIVYSKAGATPNTAEKTKKIDDSFKMFQRDMSNWLIDSNYFDQAITASQPAYQYSLNFGINTCQFLYGIPICATYYKTIYDEVITLARLGLSAFGSETSAQNALASELGFESYDTFLCVFICYYEALFSYYGFYELIVFDAFVPITIGPGFDDVNFSHKAFEIAGIADDIESGTVSELPGYEDIGTEMEVIYGIDIGGACDLSNDDDSLSIEFDRPVFCISYDLFRSVVRVAVVNSDTASGRSSRSQDKIYITGRRVGFTGPTHMAVEYTDTQGTSVTLSAGPINSKLVSKVDRAGDEPWNNQTLSTVSSNLLLPASVNFANMRLFDLRYDDDLPYHALPALTPFVFPIRYNSNGFVAGLVSKANSSPDTINFSNYDGGHRPVPANEFD